MTYQEIIKQSESLSLDKQKSLITYLIAKFSPLDKENLIQNFASQFNLRLQKKEIKKKRRLKFVGSLNLKGKLDNTNIRDLAYE